MRSKELSFWFTIGIFIIVLLGVTYRSCSVGTGEMRYVTTSVTDKNIKRASESSDIYLIYTKTDDGTIEVFQVTDSLLAGRFNSSDVYAAIEVGHKYKFGVRGDRAPLFSWYPNIYEFEEISD